MTSPKAIVIVTLDCVRPDHLGFNGYRGVDTPNMDYFAQEGTFFENAIAQAPNTWVSHGSIFSGCNPYKNGVRTPFTRLSDQVVMMAESLSEAGYATAAFPAHTLVGPSKGFDRGFDFFDLDLDEFLHSSAAGGNHFYRDWQTMWAKSKNWMLAQEEPFFVWLHYMGTHWEPQDSISLPEAYRQQYSAYGQYFDGKISWADVECIGAIREFLEENELLDDSMFVILSDHGDDLPANDPPYVWGGHNQNLFDNVMKIALLMSAPGRLPAQTRVKNQARSIDIMPTVLDVAGIPIPESVEGVSLVSFAREPEKIADDFPDAVAYMENLGRGWLALRTLDWKIILTTNPLPQPEAEEPSPGPQTTMGVMATAAKSARQMIIDNQAALNPAVASFMKAIYRGGRAVFRTVSGKKKEALPVPETKERKPVDDTPFETKILQHGRVFALYDLNNDPDEQHDVSTEHPEVVRTFLSHLQKWTKDAQLSLEEVDQRDQEELEERLKALGYL